jgi:hypothetical protein
VSLRSGKLANLLRVSSNNGDYISIERVDVDSQRFGMQLGVQVRQGNFAGAARVWVQVDDWERFVASLAKLENDRQGEATVEGMSPGELRITVRITDPLGHVAVDGQLGNRGVERTTALSFSPIDFDPSLLPAILRAAREIAG